jgi:hypothetical protein
MLGRMSTKLKTAATSDAPSTAAKLERTHHRLPCGRLGMDRHPSNAQAYPGAARPPTSAGATRKRSSGLVTAPTRNGAADATARIGQTRPRALTVPDSEGAVAATVKNPPFPPGSRPGA